MWRVIFRWSFLALCLGAALMPLWSNQTEKRATAFPGWPTEWEGRPIVQLPLTASEVRFNRDFPGEIAKFTDGQRELLLRWVMQSTRRLHSSSDCFRGSGYRVTPRAASLDAQGRRWSCFAVQRGHNRRLLRERITDEHGGEWTDVSAWFWSVSLGRTVGPWLAVTTIEEAGPKNET